MKVRELIQALQAFDLELSVLLTSEEGGLCELNSYDLRIENVHTQPGGYISECDSQTLGAFTAVIL